MPTNRKSSSAPAPSVLPPLSLAVKRVRQRYGDSQEAFAQRLSLSNMTISKFERGINTPRDAFVLEKLLAAAKAVDLTSEADQFMAAYQEARGVELVNKQYPGVLIPAVQPNPSVPFQSLPEWRLIMIALYAARYDSKTAGAIEAAGGPVRAIVDEALKNADTSRGFGPDFFRKLEAQIKAAMDAQAVKRIPRAMDDREER